MHHCLCVDEIVRFVARELITVGGKATAVALACCCKGFEDPVLDVLWETQDRLVTLLETLPEDIWRPGGYKVSMAITNFVPPLLKHSILKSFKRLPTTQEWTRLWKYSRRMRKIQELSGFLELLSSQVLSTLRLHALNEPLLPNVQAVVLWLSPVTEVFMPFIPLFLSTRTTTIDIIFPERDLHTTTTASVITTFPSLCPDLNWIRLVGLQRDPVITAALSDLVLKIRQNPLRYFSVDSPLTEEAREVVYKHPDLCTLETVVDGSAAIPTMVLPNLINLGIEFHGGHGWLQGFRGASLGKLTEFIISSDSDTIGNFLGAFESVALTTSIPATLSSFRFDTERAWGPSYRSLLPFTQLTDLVINSSCGPGCSSTIDDDTITALARAMPKLEFLRLGGNPCKTPAGVTVKGLAALAYYCPQLFNLTIHFQVASLDPTEIPRFAPADESTIPREGCALHVLGVGRIRVPKGSALKIASTLLHLFPHLEDVDYKDVRWEKVLEALSHLR